MYNRGGAWTTINLAEIDPQRDIWTKKKRLWPINGKNQCREILHGETNVYSNCGVLKRSGLSWAEGHT